MITRASVRTRPRYRVSDHFDGRSFRNVERGRTHSTRDLLELTWKLVRKPKRWPDRFHTNPQTVDRVVHEGIRITYVNHATVLIQVPGANILTDPMFSEYAGVMPLLAVRRVTDPGVRLEALPHIDAVLISHNHYDHLDLPSLRRIITRQRRDGPLVLAPLGVGAWLERRGIHENVVEMDWEESVSIGQTRIHMLEAIHTSARGLFDRDRTLWCSYMVESSEGLVYFAGDTAYGKMFRRIRERFGRPRVSLLPIGSHKPRWFMSTEHMSPDEAVRAHKDLESEKTIAIHWGTFDLALDGYREPIVELKDAMRKQRVSPRSFLVLGNGESLGIPGVEPK